jgi:hypothetical protein
MAVTNAISSVIIVGALLASGLPEGNSAKIMGCLAVILALLPSGRPDASKAPTMMTEDIALVTAIRGECKAGVTLHTT